MKYLLVGMVIAVSGVAFAAPSKTSELYVVKFKAEWCGPCKKIARSFKDVGVKELIKTYGNRDKYGKADGKPYVVDIDKKDKDTKYMVKRYGHMLRGGIPLVLIIDKRGKIIRSFRGYRSANALKRFLKP